MPHYFSGYISLSSCLQSTNSSRMSGISGKNEGRLRQHRSKAGIRHGLVSWNVKGQRSLFMRNTIFQLGCNAGKSLESKNGEYSLRRQTLQFGHGEFIMPNVESIRKGTGSRSHPPDALISFLLGHNYIFLRVFCQFIIYVHWI